MWATDSTLSVFLLTVGYHLALYLSTSNTTLLLLTAVYAVLLHRKTKHIGTTLLFLFLVTLPFAKGKGYQIIILPQELIPRYSLFKISYFFPLYLSDFILFCAVAWYARGIFLAKKIRLPSFSRTLKALLAVHLLFVAYALVHTLLSPLREVVFLSALQLFKMTFVLALPFLMTAKLTDRWKNDFFSVITASLLFQSVWALLQGMRGGPLGRHIEAVLPGFEGGIVASEAKDLMRINGTFYEPSILGTFLLMNILLAMAIWHKKWRVSPVLLQASRLAVALASVALVFTGSRGLYLFALIFMAFLWKKELTTQNVKKWLARYALGIVAVLIIAGGYLQARLTTLSDIFTRYGTASYRIAMMKYAGRSGFLNPWGSGLNTSPHTLATGFVGEDYVFDPTYPHNIFAQLFVETGIIGTVLFASFVAVFIYEGRGGKNPFFFPALGFFAAAQLYPIFLNHQEILSFFYLFIGFLFWYKASSGKYAEK